MLAKAKVVGVSCTSLTHPAMAITNYSGLAIDRDMTTVTDTQTSALLKLKESKTIQGSLTYFVDPSLCQNRRIQEAASESPTFSHCHIEHR